MKGWLKAVFAITVIVGWFLLALWMVVSVAEIAVIEQHGPACTIASNLEVTCAPHA